MSCDGRTGVSPNSERERVERCVAELREIVMDRGTKRVIECAAPRHIFSLGVLSYPRRCKLPAYWDSARACLLTWNIPAAIYGGSCGNVCLDNELGLIVRSCGVPGA